VFASRGTLTLSCLGGFHGRHDGCRSTLFKQVAGASPIQPSYVQGKAAVGTPIAKKKRTAGRAPRSRSRRHEAPWYCPRCRGRPRLVRVAFSRDKRKKEDPACRCFLQESNGVHGSLFCRACR